MKKYRSIRHKLQSIYLFIILLFIVISTIVAFIYIRGVISDQEKNFTANNFLRVSDALENTINNHLTASYMVQNSETLEKLLQNDFSEDFMDQYRMMQQIQEELTALMIPLSLDQITLYVDDRYFFSDSGPYFRPQSQLVSSEAFKRLNDSGDTYVWLPQRDVQINSPIRTKRAVSILRKICPSGTTAGYVQISLYIDQITRMLSQISSMKGAVTIIYDSGTRESICATQEAVGDIDYITQNEKQLLSGDRWFSCGSGMWVYARRIKSTDWVMATAIPNSVLIKKSIGLLLPWLFLALGVGFIGLYLANHFSKDMIRRVILLEDNMERVTEGDFEMLQNNDHAKSDEIDTLIECYNETIVRLKQLILQREQDAKRMSRLELLTLQEQINPHFLYNTLDLIHWRAMEMGDEKLVNITQALAHYYRLSLNGGQEIVHIKDELLHIRNYIEIQNYRFDHCIRLEMDIGCGVEMVSIPKLTLQPIVENAIQHGILHLRDRSSAKISVTARIQGEFVIIEICDNGIGMTAEVLQNLRNRRIKPDKEHGVGINNVDERLKLYYGPLCGISFESEENVGTCVFVKLKKELGFRVSI